MVTLNELSDYRVIALRGLPGSGKSTFAQTLVAVRDNSVIVSRDNIRRNMLGRSGSLGPLERVVTDIESMMIQQLFDKGFTLIIDRVNHSLSDVNKIRKILPEGAKIVVVNFDTPLDECLRRNALRSDWERVPEHRIIEMHAKKVAGDSTIPSNYPVITVNAKGRENG